MRSEYIDTALFYAVIEELTYPNQLAMLTSLKTGLRIDDVLSLKKDKLHIRIFVKEKKTGKYKRCYLGKQLYDELYNFAFRSEYSCRLSPYVFPHRTKYNRHRTRQAVYRDVRRAAVRLRLTGAISPHTARKCAAVREFKKKLRIEDVRKFLNHDNEFTTLLYALSDNKTLFDALAGVDNRSG